MPRNQSKPDKSNSLQHDPSFKNLITDFPEDTLRWLMPEAEQRFGKILKVDFIRQEMKKQWLSDEGRELDVPVQYTFEHQQLLIVLIEHQRDKAAFSIFKLAHYTLDVMEQFGDIPVIPMVIFADERKWRKDIQTEIRNELWGDLWMLFRFKKVKLKDMSAKEALESNNPVLNILVPTLDYRPEERLDIALKTYTQLSGVLSLRMFEKYMDFVDHYAHIQPEEKNLIIETLTKKQEGIMIRDAILQEGIQIGTMKGIEQGIEQGIEKGIEQGIEQGIEKGKWIGKIHAFESILKQPQTSTAELQRKSVEQLRQLAEALEAQLIH
ncbi:MAG: Rpn family recombination-promoting nuclease/putative transposase [SAR324 cluster bacterium]|nr:Rpn family recombination-promoting nuclease/putative transposase [SAR324 cluster bacterium]